MIIAFNGNPFTIVVGITKVCPIDNWSSMSDQSRPTHRTAFPLIRQKTTYEWLATPSTKAIAASFHRSVTLSIHSRSSTRQASWVMVCLKILQFKRIIRHVGTQWISSLTVRRMIHHHSREYFLFLCTFFWPPVESISIWRKLTVSERFSTTSSPLSLPYLNNTKQGFMFQDIQHSIDMKGQRTPWK